MAAQHHISAYTANYKSPFQLLIVDGTCFTSNIDERMTTDNSSEKIPSGIRELFSQTKVSAVINKKFQTPIVLRSDMCLTEAISVLAGAGISSAPVISVSDNSIHYILDFQDVCEMVVRYLADLTTGQDINAISSSSADELKRLNALENGSSYDALITDLTLDLDHSVIERKECGIPCIKLNDSLLTACSVFQKGLHRLLVMDDDGNFEGVLSQSDVVKFVHDHKGVAKPSLQHTLADLNLASKQIVSINWEESVFSALTLMVKEGLSSIGLLDDEGQLVGVFSMTDIKYIFHFRGFHFLKDSINDFVSEVRQLSDVMYGKTKYPVYSVRSDATMETVVDKIVATRSHRIYVTENKVPVGVVSLTDVIKSLSHELSM